MRVTLLLAVSAVIAAAAPAEARGPLQLGIQDDAVLLPSLYGYPGRPAPQRIGAARALDEARALGVSLVKLKAQWSLLEPVPGAVDTTALAATAELARERGMSVMVLLTGPAPGWANPTGRVSARRPNPTAFGAFAGAVASALRGRVASYAVWNEPNWPRSLQPRGEASARYRWLYRRAYTALRAADPDARVVFGNLAPMGTPEPAIPPLRFLRSVLCRACPGLVADGVGLHPYTLRWGPAYPGRADDATTGSLRRFLRTIDGFAARGALRSPSAAPLELELIEWAFHANSPRIPEPLRRRYVAAGLALICVQPRVRSLVWYQLAGPPPGRARVWDTGLLSFTGIRRPTFSALQELGPAGCPLVPARPGA